MSIHAIEFLKAAKVRVDDLNLVTTCPHCQNESHLTETHRTTMLVLRALTMSLRAGDPVARINSRCQCTICNKFYRIESIDFSDWV